MLAGVEMSQYCLLQVTIALDAWGTTIQKLTESVYELDEI